MDTIVALSSGQPPAAIAVMRISGPAAFEAGRAVAGLLPLPRHAALRTIRDGDGTLLDRALVLVFPGPHSSTGEDVVELHLHGGRATVWAVEHALLRLPRIRRAEPGEFTRRALMNGILDLAQAEGLADLLEAETEAQRRHALAASEGAISRQIHGWLDRLAQLSAMIEAALDFSDEGDVEDDSAGEVPTLVTALVAELEGVLAQPSVTRLRDGVQVVLAGPPNAGKSSLFNLMLEREAAIVTAIPGTTRDVLEAQVSRAGMPFRLVDTAGLRGGVVDPVERIGINRAHGALEGADVILWLGAPEDAPDGAILVRSKSDLNFAVAAAGIPTSIYEARTAHVLWEAVAERARGLMPLPTDTVLSERQRAAVADAADALRNVGSDLLIVAEQLRHARNVLAGLLGVAATEMMLDALFARFCVGK